MRDDNYNTNTTTRASGYYFVEKFDVFRLREGSAPGGVRAPSVSNGFKTYYWWQACLVYLVSECTRLMPYAININSTIAQHSAVVRDIRISVHASSAWMCRRTPACSLTMLDVPRLSGSAMAVEGGRWTSSEDNESAKEQPQQQQQQWNTGDIHYTQVVEKKIRSRNGWKLSKAGVYVIGIPGSFLLENGHTLCFWPIAWLVGCVFDLILVCTRLSEKTDRVHPFLVIASRITQRKNKS